MFLQNVSKFLSNSVALQKIDSKNCYCHLYKPADILVDHCVCALDKEHAHYEILNISQYMEELLKLPVGLWNFIHEIRVSLN